MTSIREFHNPTTAGLVCNFLQRHGLDPFVADEHASAYGVGIALRLKSPKTNFLAVVPIERR